MSSFALDPAYRRLTVEEFLDIDFGDAKAELVDGVVFMMAGGNNDHNIVAANILGSLWARLQGSGCRPYGSDQAVRTDKGTMRYPDVSVYCGNPADPEKGLELFLGHPMVVFEVFSTSTMDNDQRFKLEEYKALSGVQCIVMVEPSNGRVRQVERTGPDAWTDRWLHDDDIVIGALAITIPRRDVFRRD